MQEQEKVLKLYEKVSNLVAFRFAELVNDAANQGYYARSKSPNQTADPMTEWENKLFTAFESLV